MTTTTTQRDIYLKEQLMAHVGMSRHHIWSHYCEVCHAPDCKDSPILSIHGNVMICMNCYLREIDRGKACVAVAQQDIVGNAQ